MKKTISLWWVAVPAALVLLCLPHAAHRDPRFYVPVFILDGALIAYVIVDFALWWRRTKRKLPEMEKEHGPQIWQTLTEVSREMEAKKRGRWPPQ